MRFRRRVKICKGLSLNYSGSGISMSMGVRGASVTIGKQGIYANYGIPGTGLYNRQKIAGGKSSSDHSLSSHDTIDNTYQNTGKESNNVILRLDGNYNPVLEDTYGNVITDENLLSLIRSSQCYKDTYQRLSQEVYNNITEKNANFIEIYKHTMRPVTEYSVTKSLEKIQPKVYEKKRFTNIEPTIESVRSQLESEAKENITSPLFWTLKKKREQYVLANLQDRYDMIHERWSKEKKEFDENEDNLKKEYDEKSRKECEEKRAELLNIIAGEIEYVDKKIESILSKIELPVEFSIDYEYHPEDCTLYVDLDLPEIEDMPNEMARTLKSGKVSVKTKTQKQAAFDYSNCVCGLAFFFSGMFFNVSTRIKQIHISGYTQRLNNKTNAINDDYVYSVLFDRDTFTHLYYRNITPVEQIQRFPHLLNITASNVMKTINPQDTLQPPLDSIE